VAIISEVVGSEERGAGIDVRPTDEVRTVGVDLACGARCVGGGLLANLRVTGEVVRIDEVARGAGDAAAGVKERFLDSVAVGVVGKIDLRAVGPGPQDEAIG
jgi:hypothetical protein